MKPPEEIRAELVREWVDRAEQDLGLAEYLVSEGSPYWIAIGFHAQQAAEKFLKAYLVRHQVEFTKSHDLGYLLALIRDVDSALAESLQDVVALVPYAVKLRYPSELADKDFRDTTKALAMARKVRETIVAVLLRD